MQFCMQCGQQNDDDSMFCISCGQKIEPLSDSVPPGAASQVGEPAQQAAFEPVGSGAAADAFAQNPAAASRAPQETIDIYASSALDVLDEADEAPDDADPLQDSYRVTAEDYHDVLTSLSEIDERLEAFEGLNGRLSTMENLMVKLSEQFESKISRNEHEAAVLKSMSDEMQEYRDGLYAKLTLPLVRDIIDAREALGMALARHGEAAPGAASQLADEVGHCRAMLADSLAQNGVEVVAANPGDEFVSFQHKIVGKVPTDDAAKRGRIAEVEGDSYRLGDQFIHPALVKVYTTEDAGE